MAIDGFDELGEGALVGPGRRRARPCEPATACAAWARDAALRADWHAWHLIGDVLRSEDLASDPRHDRRLLRRVAVALAGRAGRPGAGRRRCRLGAAGASTRQARPGRWTAAGAVAAGFVLVVGTFAVVRPGESPTRAGRPGDAPGVDRRVARRSRAGAAREAAVQPVAIVADSKIIRDAQLERYLEAHKQFAGTSALGVPSAFLRSATVDSAAR